MISYIIPRCAVHKGLPEEKQIARAALSHGLALLAVSPGGQGPSSRCWDTQLPGRKQSNSDVGPVGSPLVLLLLYCH